MKRLRVPWDWFLFAAILVLCPLFISGGLLFQQFWGLHCAGVPDAWRVVFSEGHPFFLGCLVAAGVLLAVFFSGRLEFADLSKEERFSEDPLAIPVELPCGGRVPLSDVERTGDRFVCSKGCSHAWKDVSPALESAVTGTIRRHTWALYAYGASFLLLTLLSVGIHSMRRPLESGHTLTLFRREWDYLELALIAGCLIVLVLTLRSGWKKFLRLNRAP